MGHGHDAHAATQGSHGGHDAHGAAPATESHGPAEFPPIPDPRSITPAREDFEQPWPGQLLVWPFVWTAVALLFFVAARSSGKAFGPQTEEHEAGEAEGGGHEGTAPAMSEEHGM